MLDLDRSRISPAAASMAIAGVTAGLLTAAVAGIVGFFLGRRSAMLQQVSHAEKKEVTFQERAPPRTPPPNILEFRRFTSGLSESEERPIGSPTNRCMHTPQAWARKDKAMGDTDAAVRMRFVHINDVYTLENLPHLRTLLFDCGRGLPSTNLIVSIGGDLLSPYPLSALDQGKGMVDVLLQCGVRFACFGNHEADVGLMALRARIEEWTRGGGVWINTNMPDLLPELGLPTFAEVTGYSRDQQEARRVCLLGVCTEEPGLYLPPADFGGAIKSAATCNNSVLHTARSLFADPDGSVSAQKDRGKVDAVVALTHQDTEPDRELAMQGRKVGIPLVLGGHDHEECLEVLEGCVMAKAGENAHKAVVVDLVWLTPEDVEPQVDHMELLPLSSYAKNKPVARVVEAHMSKVWELAKLKGAIALTFFPAEPLMSSKQIRKLQTTMGSLLCDGMRIELDVDCVLFDAGNIRGDRDYMPVQQHRRGGSFWEFTMADLEQELPWPSEMVTVRMYGSVISKAVSWSRSQLPMLFGGFLQTDSGLLVSVGDQTQVTHISGEGFDPDRLYRVALMRASLAGMNGNPAFEDWRKFPSNTLPSADVGRPVKVLLLSYFTRSTWERLPTFNKIDLDGDGFLSTEEISKAYQSVWPDYTDETAKAVADRLLALADTAGDGRVTWEEYLRIFPMPTWMCLTIFPDAPKMSSTRVREMQTTIGHLLCNGLRDELRVDCVLFDAGSIRGDRDYVPKPGHHRGDQWVFTLADLRRELPWPSEMLVVPMKGSTIASAVAWSRSQPSRSPSAGGVPIAYGGFLQTDDGIWVRAEDQLRVTHVAGAPLEDNRIYRVALQHKSLMGMSANPFFKEWVSTPENEVPPPGLSSETLLMDYFARSAWTRMPSFDKLDTDQDGKVSWEEILAALGQAMFSADRVGGSQSTEALVRRMWMLFDGNQSGQMSWEEYESVSRRRTSAIGARQRG